MFAKVHKLRNLGVLNAGLTPARDVWAPGILEFSTAAGGGQRFGPRRLILRDLKYDPTRGVIFELYRPELVEVRERCLRLRGIEPFAMGSGSIAAMVQEWLRACISS